MSQLDMVSGPMQAAEWGTDHSRTDLTRCLWGFVWPLVAVLSMSALAVATIVLVVTTVASAKAHF